MRELNRRITFGFLTKIGIATLLVFCFAAFGLNISAQTLLVNYDFAGATDGTPCGTTPLTTAAGVTSTFSTGGACTTPTGAAATSPPAFTANALNDSVSISGFTTGSSNFFQFQLSGVGSYQDYMLFFQNQASNTGADSIDVQYSTDGTNFTTFQTFTAAALLVNGAITVDLSSVTAIEGQPTVYFRIVGRRISSGGGAAGTFRIDNFQVQATAPTAADAYISGQVTMAGGRGISKVRVMISGGDLEEPLYTLTNAFGYYKFENLTVGETYILEVTSRRYSFANPTSVVTLQDNVSGTNFIGEFIKDGGK
jgi:hypothetical protein